VHESLYHNRGYREIVNESPSETLQLANSVFFALPTLDNCEFGRNVGGNCVVGRQSLDPHRAQDTWLVLRAVHNSNLSGAGVAQQKCEHSRRVKGILEFDFARLSDPNGPRYSTPVSVAVCEECGHVELYSQMPRLLCDWLRRPDTDEI